MTKLLDQAVLSAQRLPPTMQDDLARLILSFAGEAQPDIVLTAAEEEALDRSEQAAARGEFASDAAVRAVWTKHGL